MVYRYEVPKTDAVPTVPLKIDPEGWVPMDKQFKPAPTLWNVPVALQLALRITLKSCGLPSQDMNLWFADVKDKDADALLRSCKSNGRRRLLTSEAVGYGPHDHASTRRHIRLVTSEAAVGHAY